MSSFRRFFFLSSWLICRGANRGFTAGIPGSEKCTHFWRKARIKVDPPAAFCRPGDFQDVGYRYLHDSGFELNCWSHCVGIEDCNSMAATSRYGSMMLSRIAAPAQARAFSTSLAVRFNASRSLYDDRRNPLVGNFVPPAPAPKPVVPPKARSEPASTDFVPPPPPPPAESESPSSSAEQPAAEKSTSSSSFPYTAADSSAPFNFDIAEIVAARSAAYGQSLNVGDPLLRPKIRTEAVTGRTVFIKDRLSPTSAPTPAVAIRVLERMCRDQKVRNKYHSQKFHERKGLKKKRLRSQRWRARFKTGFKAAVNKVLELKKQGW